MPIDRELLARSRRFDDRAGFSEEFIRPQFGDGATVAVVSRPHGPSRRAGWVICHSFAMEQLHLDHLCTVVARALAAAGFPVIRYHGQGYGDSQVEMSAISLQSHLEDARSAVTLLSELDGVERIGLMGPRFGGTVAALVADQDEHPYMALWEPSTRGGQYMRDFLRTELFAEMMGSSSAGPGRTDELRAQLASQGWADIKGFRLTREAHDAIASIDLSSDLSRFRGDALLISVSRTPRATPGVAKLAHHLEGLGARSTLRVQQDRFAPQFGQFHFQTVEGGQAKRDVRVGLDAAIASASVEWAVAVAEDPPSADAVCAGAEENRR